jgi:hypothetical protein
MTEARACQIAECTRNYYAKGFCAHHYQKNRTNRIRSEKEEAAALEPEAHPFKPILLKTCAAWGCESTVYGMGVCKKHYYEWNMEGQFIVASKQK